MKYLLLGAGLQGTAIAHDLLNQAEGTTSLTVVDGNTESLDNLQARLADPRLHTAKGDVRDSELMSPLMADADVAISAVNYWFNADLAAMAVSGKTHFLDLGGNNDIVAREFELNDEATAAGITIVPDCGLAPGLAGILGYWLADNLEKVDSLKLRVGGLPAKPQPPMNYKVVFSVQGLINEYIEPAVVIRGGKLQTVPSLSELETLVFPAPFGELEAFQTSGGTSTLPRTLAGRVPDLDYKTIRYKGHCAQFKLLYDLGLCDSKLREGKNGSMSPREMLVQLMDEKLDLPGEDVVLLQAEVVGYEKGDQAIRRTVRIIDHHDHTHNITAMMRMTGYPAAIIAQLLASGEICAPGTKEQELIVPGDRMIELLRQRGVEIEIFEGNPGEPA
ncbi:MAG: saccharopine dehydrogenase [bacterium]|nr:saccharopine dehydrogenase [bacterium]